MITSLCFINNDLLVVGTALGVIYMYSISVLVFCRLNCSLNRVVFCCDMSMNPIIQILTFQQVHTSNLFFILVYMAVI